MGLPTSWCLLSLIHLWWMDEVASTSRSRALRAAHKFHICGDDALLATTLRGSVRYKELVRLCGGLPSEGKHFESVPGPSGNLRGVFLERLFSMSVGQTGRISGGQRAPCIAVKGLTGKHLPRTFIGEDPIHCRSLGILQIVVLDNLSTGPHAELPI